MNMGRMSVELMRPKKEEPMPMVLHEYRDAQGRLIFIRQRIHKDDGSKEVYYKHGAGREWLHDLADTNFLVQHGCVPGYPPERRQVLFRPVRLDKEDHWCDGSREPDSYTGRERCECRPPIGGKPSSCDACFFANSPGFDIADGLLYRLPAVTAGLNAGMTDVCWTEGETDADALAARGVLSVSHHQGAGRATPEQAASLLRLPRPPKRVLLAGDRDDDGTRCLLRRYDLLVQAGYPPDRILCVLPKPEHDKADIRDHLTAGHPLKELVTVNDLEALRDSVPRYYTDDELTDLKGMIAKWQPKRK